MLVPSVSGGDYGCTSSGVLLGVEHTLLCALRFTQDLFEVLVAALGWAPVGIAEGFGDFVHVEGVEKGGVCFFVGCSCYGGHCYRILLCA